MTFLPRTLALLKSSPGTPDPDTTNLFLAIGSYFITEILAWMLGYLLGLLFRAPLPVGALAALIVGLLPALGPDPSLAVPTVAMAGLVITIGCGLHRLM